MIFARQAADAKEQEQLYRRERQHRERDVERRVIAVHQLKDPGEISTELLRRAQHGLASFGGIHALRRHTGCEYQSPRVRGRGARRSRRPTP